LETGLPVEDGEVIHAVRDPILSTDVLLVTEAGKALARCP
jgi:hypothetical protein